MSGLYCGACLVTSDFEEMRSGFPARGKGLLISCSFTILVRSFIKASVPSLQQMDKTSIWSCWCHPPVRSDKISITGGFWRSPGVFVVSYHSCQAPCHVEVKFYLHRLLIECLYHFWYDTGITLDITLNLFWHLCSFFDRISWPCWIGAIFGPET